MTEMRTDVRDEASTFDLPGSAHGKAGADFVGGDERHFRAVRAAMGELERDLGERLAATLARPGGSGQAALDRDLEVHRLRGRLRVLRRAGGDLCLGRMVLAGREEPIYLGRLGLHDAAGEQLLVDWRTPAAAPFFAATPAEPMGVLSRRRYRWSEGRVVDYWDEVVAPGVDARALALDDQSAFLAGLGSSRQVGMQEVLGTIQADQDAAIRADSRGVLVVEGGPGTGKTVVVLHRAAYLQYADPRLRARPEGVLVIGPHRPYLRYVSDVLPGLSEEGVATVTLEDLVPGAEDAVPELDPRVAELKSRVGMVDAVEAGVRWFQEAPDQRVDLETPWGPVHIGATEWAEAFAAVDRAVPHNHARGQIWEALATGVAEELEADAPGDSGGEDEGDDGAHDADTYADTYGDANADTYGDANAAAGPEVGAEVSAEAGADVDSVQVERWLRREPLLARLIQRGWPVLDPEELVADLWTVPAFLRLCAPWLTGAEVGLLQRPAGADWTVCDVPLLDAARALVGDPKRAEQRRRQRAAIAEQREYMDSVVTSILEADADGEGAVTMLHGGDLREALEDADAAPGVGEDRWVGPFTHIVVDEAQELTPAQWQMVLRRCPSRSVTVVGDRAQARGGFAQTWQERLAEAGMPRVTTVTLRVNYRTPAEVMEVAAPVIRAVLPDAQVPSSVRSSGREVQHGAVAELEGIVTAWLAERETGTVCVISSDEDEALTEAGGRRRGLGASERVRWLSPVLAKGLEFDLVVLVRPERWGAVDRYVAMTRTTQHLVILT